MMEPHEHPPAGEECPTCRHVHYIAACPYCGQGPVGAMVIVDGRTHKPVTPDHPMPMLCSKCTQLCFYDRKAGKACVMNLDVLDALDSDLLDACSYAAWDVRSKWESPWCPMDGGETDEGIELLRQAIASLPPPIEEQVCKNLIRADWWYRAAERERQFGPMIVTALCSSYTVALRRAFLTSTLRALDARDAGQEPAEGQ